MVLGNPSKLSSEEFSTSALEYVSGLVLATTFAAGHNQSIVRRSFPQKHEVVYDEKDSLTKILREDGRIGEGFSAYLTKTTNVGIPCAIFPNVELYPSVQAPLIQLEKLSKMRKMYVLNIFNTNLGPEHYQFLDMGCFIYGKTTKNEFIYSMQISPVHFQNRKGEVTHYLPTSLVYRVNTEPTRLYSTEAKIVKGKPIGLRGASITVSHKYPDSTVYRVINRGDQVFAYLPSTKWNS
jgi:hypothetical protein